MNLLQEKTQQYLQKKADFERNHFSPEELAVLEKIQPKRDVDGSMGNAQRVLQIGADGSRSYKDLPPLALSRSMDGFPYENPMELPAIPRVFDTSNVDNDARLDMLKNPDFQFRSANDLYGFMRRNPTQFIQSLERDDNFRSNFMALLPLMYTSEIRSLAQAFQSKDWQVQIGSFPVEKVLLEPQARDFFEWTHKQADMAHNNPYHKMDSFYSFHKDRENQRSKMVEDYENHVAKQKERNKEYLENAVKTHEIASRHVELSNKFYEQQVMSYLEKMAELRRQDPNVKFSIFEQNTAQFLSALTPPSLRTGDKAHDATIGILMLAAPQSFREKSALLMEHNPEVANFLAQYGITRDNVKDPANTKTLYVAIAKGLKEKAFNMDENDAGEFMSDKERAKLEQLKEISNNPTPDNMKNMIKIMKEAAINKIKIEQITARSPEDFEQSMNEQAQEMAAAVSGMPTYSQQQPSVQLNNIETAQPQPSHKPEQQPIPNTPTMGMDL